MLDTLYYAGALVVALSLLVTIHEYGHFWVARKMGIKVLRFSVGFGKPIWKHVSKKDGVEYVIAAIPLGGYVKMLGEQNAEEITPENRDQAFCNKSIRARSAVVFAGPLANFIFSIFAFSLLFMVGTPDIKPFVTNTIEGTYAHKAGFQPGDLVLKVDNEAVKGWATVDSKLFSAFFSNQKLVMEVQTSQAKTAIRVIDFTHAKTDIDPKKFRRAIGFVKGFPATIGAVSKNIGVEANYRVSQKLQTLMLNQQFSFGINLSALLSAKILDYSNQTSEFINTPAAKAGLKIGDNINHIQYVDPLSAVTWSVNSSVLAAAPMNSMLQLNLASFYSSSKPIYNWNYFAATVRDFPGKTIWFHLTRNQKQSVLKVQPMIMHYRGQVHGFVGISALAENVVPIVVQYGFFTSISKSIDETYSLSVLMLKVFGKMVVGEASRKNVSGLLTIAEYSGKSAQYGWDVFLRFLAVISISLGVINLLPIPILDGGHLVYFLIEAIKGSPVTENIRSYGNLVGASLLISLMVLAFYNDFERLLG